MAVGKILEGLAVVIVSGSSKATHFNQAIRHTSEGREYYGEVVSGSVIVFQDINNAEDALRSGDGRAAEF
jgi:hypothetical protein